jgi:hypothetical protein
MLFYLLFIEDKIMSFPTLPPYPELPFRWVLKTVRHARSEWNLAMSDQERKTHVVEELQKQDPSFSFYQAIKIHALFQVFLATNAQHSSINFRSMGKELVTAQIITENERIQFNLAVAYSSLRDFKSEVSTENEAKKMFRYFWDHRQFLDERKCNRMLVKLRNFSFSKKICHDFLSKGCFFEAFKLMLYQRSSPLIVTFDLGTYPSEARLWYHFFQGLHKFQASHEEASLLEEVLLKERTLPADFQMILKDFCTCLIRLIHSEGLKNNHLIDSVLITIFTTFAYQIDELVPEDINVRMQFIEILERYFPFCDPEWKRFNAEDPTLDQTHQIFNSEIYCLHKAYRLGCVYNACQRRDGSPPQKFSPLLWQILAFRCIPSHSEKEFTNTRKDISCSKEQTVAFLNVLATDDTLEPEARGYIAFGQAMLREQIDVETFELLGKSLPYLTGYFQRVAIEKMNQFSPTSRSDLLRVAMGSTLHVIYFSRQHINLPTTLPKISFSNPFTLRDYVYAQLHLHQQSLNAETLIPYYWSWINMFYMDSLETTQSFREAYVKTEPFIQNLMQSKEELLARLAQDQNLNPLFPQELDQLCQGLLEKVVERWRQFAEKEMKPQIKDK